MIAFDTNLLVRLVTEDDPEQFAAANRWLLYCEEHEEPCLIKVPVLCELLWVVKRLYGASRYDLALVVETLLNDDLFIVEDSESVTEALRRFRAGGADFADYLIGVNSAARGASTTLTFDAALRQEFGFTWIDAAKRTDQANG